MNFTNPLFLYGLFALSIPVIVHLFNFRKAKKVYFSNTQFLKHVKETSSAKRRLKHYLVLVSRLLFVFFLVMAFAQPFLPADEEGFNNNSVTIYLDNSQSMSNHVNGDLSAMDDAIQYVNEIVGLYPRGTQFRLLTNDFTPFSNSNKGAVKVLDYITELRLSGVGRTLEEVKTRAQSLAQAQGIGSEDIYFISDFQRSSVGDLSALTLDSANNYHFVPLQFDQTANLSVDTVYVKNPFIINRDKIELVALMRNAGNEEVSNVNVRVFINNIQMASASVDVAGESTKVLNFDLVYDLKDQNKVRISFDEYPVTFDNDFYLTVSPREKVKVVELKEDLLETAIEKVYGNEQLFEVSSFQVTNIDYSEVERADMVVVNELPHISEALAGLLKEYHNKGGRLVYIPHPDSRIEDFTNLMPGLAVEKLNLLLESEMMAMTKPDLNNPFFENIFEEQKSTFGMPKGHARFQWPGKVNDLISFNNQNPFLSYNNQNGHLFLFSSPLAEEYTDFTNHALFVPIMYKMATHSASNTNSLYQLLDASHMTAKPDVIRNDDVYKLVQEQNEVIPDQRIDGNEVVMQIPRHALQAGFANLVYRDDTVQLIALNSNKAESMMEQYSAQDLQKEFGELAWVKIFDSADAKTFSKEIKERYLGVPLWKYALLLAVLFLVMEVLIIRFYKQNT